MAGFAELCALRTYCSDGSRGPVTPLDLSVSTAHTLPYDSTLELMVSGAHTLVLQPSTQEKARGHGCRVTGSHPLRIFESPPSRRALHVWHPMAVRAAADRLGRWSPWVCSRPAALGRNANRERRQGQASAIGEPLGHKAKLPGGETARL